jgi:hypothetical protein
MMNEVLEKIGPLRLAPVVNIENSNDAVQLGQALLQVRLPKLRSGLPALALWLRRDSNFKT